MARSRLAWHRPIASPGSGSPQLNNPGRTSSTCSSSTTQRAWSARSESITTSRMLAPSARARSKCPFAEVQRRARRGGSSEELSAARAHGAILTSALRRPPSYYEGKAGRALKRWRTGRLGAAASIPLPAREPSERDQPDERDDQPDPEAPHDHQHDPDDHDDAAERYPADCALTLRFRHVRLLVASGP